MSKETIKLGIGFATGRKSFRKVLNAYMYNWKESQLYAKIGPDISLNLFVAYDVDYSNTQSTDFTNLSQEVVDTFDEIVFLGAKNAQRGVVQMVEKGSITAGEAKQVFGAGYAGKRNAVLYAAIESGMDYLLFLDDDEYPVAVTNTSGDCLWSGQHVLAMHLEHIADADITNGHHCGYISPIPHIGFDETLTEEDFRRFIEAISNDIITWDSVRRIMNDGGVTYAEIATLISQQAVEVEEEKHCKFISGANLCINLRDPSRVFPFFNPPGARGEDTFLSTLLTERRVVRVPCYAFHDGFSAYRHLLDGVLPLRLAPIAANSGAIVTRFYNACVGWVRYKPLLLYIQDPAAYRETVAGIQRILEETAPKLCLRFNCPDFAKVPTEFLRYSKNVEKHAAQFAATQTAWKKLLTATI